MVKNKYTPKESLDRMKLMMNYNSSKTLTENKELISSILQLKSNNTDYVFDFVVAEQNGFLIYMDNVLSRKHGFIGNIWENTWVFNEIIRENIHKCSNVISESIQKDLDTILMSINWTKEFVTECLLNMDDKFKEINLNEQFLDNLGKAWDSFSKNVSDTASKIKSKVSQYAEDLFKGPILGTLRWIRKHIYSNIGMVVDIVTAMLPATTGINKIVWFMIVILDIYEILMSDYDPDDPDRNQMPYFYLIMDLISAIFTVGLGAIFRSSKGVITKILTSGGKNATGAGAKQIPKLPSQVTTLLKKVLDFLPKLRGTLKSISEFLEKNLPSIKKILDFVFNGIDRIVKGIEDFIGQLLSKTGVKALATAGVISAVFYNRPLKLGDSGIDVEAANKFLLDYNSTWGYMFKREGCRQIDKNTMDGLMSSGNKFTKSTETAVKILEACFSKHSPFNNVFKKIDGKISDGEIGAYAEGMQLNDRNIITKWIPHETKEATAQYIMSAMTYLANKAEKVLGNKQKNVS